MFVRIDLGVVFFLFRVWIFVLVVYGCFSVECFWFCLGINLVLLFVIFRGFFVC